MEEGGLITSCRVKMDAEIVGVGVPQPLRSAFLRICRFQLRGQRRPCGRGTGSRPHESDDPTVLSSFRRFKSASPRPANNTPPIDLLREAAESLSSLRSRDRLRTLWCVPPWRARDMPAYSRNRNRLVCVFITCYLHRNQSNNVGTRKAVQPTSRAVCQMPDEPAGPDC